MIIKQLIIFSLIFFTFASTEETQEADKKKDPPIPTNSHADPHTEPPLTIHAEKPIDPVPPTITINQIKNDEIKPETKPEPEKLESQDINTQTINSGETNTGNNNTQKPSESTTNNSETPSSQPSNNNNSHNNKQEHFKNVEPINNQQNDPKNPPSTAKQQHELEGGADGEGYASQEEVEHSHEHDIYSDESSSEMNEMVRAWEEEMADFIADETLTFEVKPGESELLIEEIDHPTRIRGTYVVSSISNARADFMILSPSKQTLFHKLNRRYGLFYLDVKEIGEYKFYFLNEYGNKIDVTFGLDVRNKTETHLKHTDLTPIEQRLLQLSSHIQDMQKEYRFMSKDQLNQLDQLVAVQSKLLRYAILEIIVVISVSSWQIYYIKKILDNKRIV